MGAGQWGEKRTESVSEESLRGEEGKVDAGVAGGDRRIVVAGAEGRVWWVIKNPHPALSPNPAPPPPHPPLPPPSLALPPLPPPCAPALPPPSPPHPHPPPLQVPTTHPPLSAPTHSPPGWGGGGGREVRESGSGERGWGRGAGWAGGGGTEGGGGVREGGCGSPPPPPRITFFEIFF